MNRKQNNEQKEARCNFLVGRSEAEAEVAVSSVECSSKELAAKRERCSREEQGNIHESQKG